MSRSLMTPPYSSSSDESTPPPQLSGEPAMSTTFRKDADLLAGEQPDTVLLSADNVAFYVHSRRLRVASTNSLCGLLVPGAERTRPRASNFGIELPVLVMPEDSNVLNIVLHAMYGLDASRYNPPFETVSRAVVALTGVYGVPIHTIFSPHNPIYACLEFLASVQPLRVYALAGHYCIESLAVTASSYLLSYPLSRITDEDAEYMGGRFLRRLFFLHLGRIDRLKSLLNRPPDPHPATEMCDPEDQKKVNRAWALGTSFLIFNAAADTAASSMEASLAPLVAQIWCPDCRAMLQKRLNQLCAEWNSVKRTI